MSGFTDRMEIIEKLNELATKLDHIELVVNRLFDVVHSQSDRLRELEEKKYAKIQKDAGRFDG